MPKDAPEPFENLPTSPPSVAPGGGAQPGPAVPPAPTLALPAAQLFYQVTLPDRIPDAWLTDLKNAVRESRSKLIITTVLSSSLLTGILSTVGNYYIDTKKEVRVAALELRKDRAREKLRLYDSLAGKLNDFKRTLDLSSNIFDNAKTHPADKKAASNVADSVQTLLNKLKEVADARAAINDGEVTALIDDTARPLTPELAKASGNPQYLRDPKVMNNLISVCKSISNQGMTNLRQLVEKKIKEIEALER